MISKTMALYSLYDQTFDGLGKYCPNDVTGKQYAAVVDGNIHCITKNIYRRYVFFTYQHRVSELNKT